MQSEDRNVFRWAGIVQWLSTDRTTKVGSQWQQEIFSLLFYDLLASFPIAVTLDEWNTIERNKFNLKNKASICFSHY
jgi:hypothetical protein